MEVVICRDADEVARVGAAKIASVCKRRPQPILGVATGSSPLGVYRQLAALVDSGALALDQATVFALDEYVGLPAGHPESYAEVVRATVTEPLHLDPARVHVPDGGASDLEAAAQGYEDAIAAAGGIDVQLLGVGANGHVGFNEPSSSLRSRTRLKTLTRATREANARFFDSVDDVPLHCLTQGLGTIMDAHDVVLVAQGEGKADAIAGLVEGPVTALCPGSVLQFHPRATVVVDDAAAGGLRLADYYREVWAGKPAHQRYL